MRFRLHLALLLLLAPAAVHAEKPRKPTPPLPAAQYPFHDTHPAEKVTVAAEPCDTKDLAPNTRLDYLHHGFLPLRVIITNDSADPLSLDDARIMFVPAEGSPLNAATDDDLQRRLFSSKSVAGKKIPLPAPLPSITIHNKPVDKQILADDTDFGFTSSTIAPHTTAAGYLFYDTRDLDSPILKNASLELRRARFASTNKLLDSFEIPLTPSNLKDTTTAHTSNP